MNVGEEEKEGGREGGRSLSCYGKSGCSSCTLPIQRCFLGQGLDSARQHGFTVVDTFLKKKKRKKDRDRGSRGDLARVLSAA